MNKLFSHCICLVVALVLLNSCNSKSPSTEKKHNSRSTGNRDTAGVAKASEDTAAKANEEQHVMLTAVKNRTAWQLYPDMSKEELRLMRNSIFARYGRAFQSKDLQQYFLKTDWYEVNPDYTDALLTEQDKEELKLIQLWEGIHRVIWSGEIDYSDSTPVADKIYYVSSSIGQADPSNYVVVNNKVYLADEIMWRNFEADLDGNGSMDAIGFMLFQENSKGLLIINNQQKIVRINNQDFDMEENVQIKVVDIDKNDSQKEVWLSQLYDEIEDPGRESTFFILNGKGLATTTIGAENYNAGAVTFLGNGQLILDNSFGCHKHTITYSLVNGGLEKEAEAIDPFKEGEIQAACFTADAHVLLANNNYRPINSITRGDTIISYNIQSGACVASVIQQMATVEHCQLVELYFANDTITATPDHPFYVAEKGWASFSPDQTLHHYSNYTQVGAIAVGDKFLSAKGQYQTLLGYSRIEDCQPTYTITLLEKGNNFYVNGILVGVEQLAQPLHVNHKKISLHK